MRDRQAHDEFVSWVQGRQHRLLRSTYLLTGDVSRAEDLVQDALIKVAKHWEKLRNGNPDAYVRTILYRDNVSWWRSRREYPTSSPRDGATPYDGDVVERSLMIADALAHLTKKQRAVLVLRYFDDLTERETAEILGVTVGTVKSQSSVALARLRELPELDELRGKNGDR